MVETVSHPTVSPITKVPDGPLNPKEGVSEFRQQLEAGVAWYPALLNVISRWTAPSEYIDGRTRHYLINGEAFDWLSLAERLIINADSLLPAEETEKLVLFGISPVLSRNGQEEIAFELAIGAAKYRAFLNYQYGVIVEQLVLAAAEEKLVKNASIFAAIERPYADEQAFNEVYGAPFKKLRSHYRGATGMLLTENTTRGDFEHFLYWLSKYRIRHMEPARIASDTRQAMILLSRLEQRRNRFISQSSDSLTAGSVYLYSIESNPHFFPRPN
jgi:hypothetical protein